MAHKLRMEDNSNSNVGKDIIENTIIIYEETDRMDNSTPECQTKKKQKENITENMITDWDKVLTHSSNNYCKKGESVDSFLKRLLQKGENVDAFL